MGIKEVPIQQLIPSKTYFFFSHTIKKQPHNRKLLAAILAKKVRMIDYETLADDNHVRLVAFGHFAGIVGAHNGMMTYGNRTQLFQLPQMIQFGEYKHAKEAYKTLQLPPMKIVVTGTGRVSSGAVEVLNLMGIRQLTPQQFIEQSFDEPVYTQVDCDDYVVHNQLQTFVSKTDYYQHPENYSMRFAPYYQQADLLINGIYWDKRYPPFFSPDEMARPDFRIRVIADITCDIAPNSSIPSTLDASTIAQPVYGYDPQYPRHGSSLIRHIL
jgi:saccharopine dehydrogenase (NAD+, L-lysine-forming)